MPEAEKQRFWAERAPIEHMRSGISLQRSAIQKELRERRVERRHTQRLERLKKIEDEDIKQALYHSMHENSGETTGSNIEPVVTNEPDNEQENENMPQLQSNSDQQLTPVYSDENSFSDEQEKSPYSGSSDEDFESGQLEYLNGDVIGRFEVIKTLGKGTFCSVVQVKDLNDSDIPMRAMKIVRNIRRYKEAAREEIAILETLKAEDPNGSYIVKFLEHFEFRGHICLVFELLGKSVYDILKDNNYQPYSIEQIRYIAYQLIRSVNFMHKCQFVHTDLKPENILFVDSTQKTIMVSNSKRRRRGRKKKSKTRRELEDATIRLIDFGSAVFQEDADHFRQSIISTREYRAPEVIMKIGWTYAADIWSIGCILFELYTGNQLFQPERGVDESTRDREHLAMIEHILGYPFPFWMGRKSEKRTDYFQHGSLIWDGKRKWTRLRNHKRTDSVEDALLFQLITEMLSFVQDQPDSGVSRITLADALKHKFFDQLDPILKAKADGLQVASAIENGSISHQLN